MVEIAENRLVPLVVDGLEAGRFAAEVGFRLPALDRVMELPRRRAFVLGAASFLVILALDAFTPIEMSFAFAYVLPIALATWAMSLRAGLVIGTLAASVIAVLEWEGHFPYSSPIYLYWTFGVRLAFYLAYAWALAALKATYQRALADTMRDAETGLWNRRAFYSAVAVESRRATRFNRSLSIATFALDAPLADEDVAKVARALTGSRLYDVAARVAPSVFVVLLPETGAEQARIAVERMRNEASLRAAGRVAIATFEWPPTCVDDLLREADRAMAQAKGMPSPCLRHAVLRGGAAVPLSFRGSRSGATPVPPATTPTGGAGRGPGPHSS